MLSDDFGMNFFFFKVSEFWHFVLNLLKGHDLPGHLLADLLIHCVFKKLKETIKKGTVQITATNLQNLLTECLHGTISNHFHTRRYDNQPERVQIPDLSFLFFFCLKKIPSFVPVYFRRKETANQHMKSSFKGKSLHVSNGQLLHHALPVNH